MNRLYPLTMGLASALAGVGGVFLGALYFASPTAGDLPLLQALIVVVLGGLGSLTGTLYAAYLVGLMQAFCEVEIGTTWTLPILYTRDPDHPGHPALRPQGQPDSEARL